MKRTFTIIGAAVVLGAIAIFMRMNHTDEREAGRTPCYNNKMSLMCEMTCAAKKGNPSNAKPQSQAMAGDQTTCPVSGVLFIVTSESSKITHKNKSAYTCCGSCAEIFNKEPEVYAENIR